MPRLTTLFVAVLLGALIGSLIPPLVERRRGRAGWPRAFAAAALTSVLAEALALWLAANDSGFHLLGVELDPYQLLPAAVLGGVLGIAGSGKAADRILARIGIKA